MDIRALVENLSSQAAGRVGKAARIIEILLCLAILLFWIFAGGDFLLFGQEANIPPDVLMVNSLTCRIEPHGKHKWTATGIAHYFNHDTYHHEPWETPPFPERKSDTASLKDCDRWFDAVHKVQAVTRPVDVNELLKKKEKK